MPARLLEGHPVAEEILRDVREQIRTSATQTPLTVAVLLGDDAAARSYARAIRKTMAPLGIEVRTVPLDDSMHEERFREIVTQLNRQADITGILALQPLPPGLPRSLPALSIAPEKDVDGITPVNAGRLLLGLPAIAPSTPAGAMELLRYYGIPVSGRRAVIVGRSPVVGRPLVSLLLAADATVTVCHRKTSDLADVTRTAELLFVAAGSPALIKPDMVRPGTVVIDFGVNAVGEHLVGDVDPAVAEVASAITPVPGGTGPVTNAILARNLLTLAKLQRS
ncbi:bifunctional 5,10-methylenetetrahydrofolate dehydrogenase/5,10-methenyltetrahydrofolate cyclohydrolase [Thermomicrobiaceae bacterium CFH 74404]|uniref:Bifunctional protein FolD n=1 Tax=Thermalbibacter longus TaxID=2951981 RepID=A0AA41WBX0_9BACT|nr:bifunctional 5,10-methylenetetrahydrofolate dehydrogenase/5,10-methenyltetrahydrofolate cyclohydrolase [Thermalbibacter longus]MCM8748118.1 bifunctional 5,10-methylenetetrahydrofolate dehydrogenase/5,10-methenyltetrahydrofolate cyclohydrolase [Thermalbibacter longus]